MSPKSRGRPKGRGRDRRTVRPARRKDMIDQIVSDAAALVREEDALLAEAWASSWLGGVWAAAAGIEDGEPEDPSDAEVGVCRLLALRVMDKPAAAGLAALHAFTRVAPPDGAEALDAAIEGVGDAVHAPAFAAVPPASPTRAWTAVDIWDAERMIFVEFGEPTHTLVAQVLDVGGRLVETLALLIGPDAAKDWADHRTEDDVPMEPVEVPVEVALADLADALAATDVTGEVPDDEGFTDLRSLAWARSLDHATVRPDPEQLSEAERAQLATAFFAQQDVEQDETTESLVNLFLDFGDAFLFDGPLSWSPIAVMIFLEEALPGRVVLDEDQEEALPGLLKAWLRFALGERGVPDRWVAPVVAAVDEGMSGFTEAHENLRQEPVVELGAADDGEGSPE